MWIMSYLNLLGQKRMLGNNSGVLVPGMVVIMRMRMVSQLLQAHNQLTMQRQRQQLHLCLGTHLSRTWTLLQQQQQLLLVALEQYTAQVHQARHQVLMAQQQQHPRALMVMQRGICWHLQVVVGCLAVLVLVPQMAWLQAVAVTKCMYRSSSSSTQGLGHSSDVGAPRWRLHQTPLQLHLSPINNL
jgi:hypothetical protein